MTVSDSWCNSTFKCLKVLLEVAFKTGRFIFSNRDNRQKERSQDPVWGTCDLRKDMIFPLRLTTKEGSQNSMTN